MIEKIVYCPRCDRPFTDPKDRRAALRKMEEHMRKAHPDYVPMYED